MMASNEAVRELTVEESELVSGGASRFGQYVAVHQFVHPLDIVSVNPQPDPPGCWPGPVFGL
jgi:hypothetical protein